MDLISHFVENSFLLAYFLNDEIEIFLVRVLLLLFFLSPFFKKLSSLSSPLPDHAFSYASWHQDGVGKTGE